MAPAPGKIHHNDLVSSGLSSGRCPNPKYFEAVHDGAIPHHLFYMILFDSKTAGPFRDEKAFDARMIRYYGRITETNEFPSAKHDFYATYLGPVFRGHRSVLTHSDVQRKT